MDQPTELGESEEIVWLQGPIGRMFGILHRPSKATQCDTCVIMLNSGQISRVGPQRLYVKAARHWARLGFTVLRIDLAGVGDSEAENDIIHFDNHSPVEVVGAVRYARNELQANNIILQGLCAGARVALKSAARWPDVDGVIAWSCPVFSAADGMPESPEEVKGRMSAPRARESVGRLRNVLTTKRVLTFRWWANRIRYGRSELGELWRALRFFLRGKPVATSRFLEATDDYLRYDRPALFVYGDRDRISLAEFQERFASVPEGGDSPQTYCIVPGGTHTFNSFDSQQAVIEESSSWLEAKFPIGTAREVPVGTRIRAA